MAEEIVEDLYDDIFDAEQDNASQKEQSKDHASKKDNGLVSYFLP